MHQHLGLKRTAKVIKKIMISFFKVILVLILSLQLTGCSEPKFKLRQKFLMGTVVEVTVRTPRAAKLIFDEFKVWDEKLSKFRQESLVGTLNRKGEVKTQDKDFLQLIKRAKEFSKLTMGAFDITSAPLIDIWKQAIEKDELPSKDNIKRALSLVDWRKLIVIEEAGLVRFKRKDMEIDLGAIAKGFAVDKAVAKLKAAGISEALINAGGDIYCLGTKSGKPWKVGVQNPRDKTKIDQILTLSDKAVATSGDYEQFAIIEGKRISHIVDPRTGYSAGSQICSVTVVANDCTTADALATAIFVLGEKQGLKLASKFNVDEVKIVKDCQ